MVQIKLKDVLAKAKNEPPFLGSLLMDPKRTLVKNKMELSAIDTKNLELFLLNSQTCINNALKFAVGDKFEASWGIGASCCNSKMLRPGSTINDKTS